MARELTYLACPYTHPSRGVRLQRFQAVNKAAAMLMANGIFVFSPLSHSHPIAEAGGLPLDFKFWEEYDLRMLGNCNSLTILTMDGWVESRGVTAELRRARELKLHVGLMTPPLLTDYETDSRILPGAPIVLRRRL